MMDPSHASAADIHCAIGSSAAATELGHWVFAAADDLRSGAIGATVELGREVGRVLFPLN